MLKAGFSTQQGSLDGVKTCIINRIIPPYTHSLWERNGVGWRHLIMIQSFRVRMQFPWRQHRRDFRYALIQSKQLRKNLTRLANTAISALPYIERNKPGSIYRRNTNVTIPRHRDRPSTEKQGNMSPPCQPSSCHKEHKSLWSSIALRLDGSCFTNCSSLKGKSIAIVPS